MLRRLPTLTLLLAISVAPHAAGGSTPLPYDVAVEVEYGRGGGPESFRDDLVTELVASLVRHRCFRSVEREAPEAPDPDDLTIEVFVSELTEETEWDMSIAARSAPNAEPGTERRHTARIRVDVVASVVTTEGSLVVRSKRFRQSSSHRPLVSGDSRFEARMDAVDSLARSIRTFACKGSPTKWSRELARARTSR